MLNRLALRICTVEALRGRTYAGANVFDSRQATIDEIAFEVDAAPKPMPTISVYTDDGHFRPGDRSLFNVSGDHRHNVGFQRLVIEIVLTQRMVVTDDSGAVMRNPDGSVLTELIVLDTDPTIEFYLDIIERQVSNCLMVAGNAWSEMWKGFVLDIGDHESKRGQGARDAMRFSGRQKTIHVKMPNEFAPGQAITPLWQGFFDLCTADADLAKLVPQMRAALLGAPLTDDWDQTQAQFGLTTGETRAMGFGPPQLAIGGPRRWRSPTIFPTPSLTFTHVSLTGIDVPPTPAASGS